VTRNFEIVVIEIVVVEIIVSEDTICPPSAYQHD
jgi:hypothetical protein